MVACAGGIHARAHRRPRPSGMAGPAPAVRIGGGGQKRTPRVAARFADEYNVPFGTLEDNEAAFGRVRDACREAGRDPESLVYSAAQTVCCGRDDAELARRAPGTGVRAADVRPPRLAGAAP